MIDAKCTSNPKCYLMTSIIGNDKPINLVVHVIDHMTRLKIYHFRFIIQVKYQIWQPRNRSQGG